MRRHAFKFVRSGRNTLAAHDGLSVGVLVLPVIRQDDDGMRLRNLGAAQDHFVGRVTFDDVNVVEGGFILQDDPDVNPVGNKYSVGNNLA